jgi:hypothetical protein
LREAIHDAVLGLAIDEAAATGAAVDTRDAGRGAVN